MHQQPIRSINQAFIDSLPILFSFLPLGFGFGYIGQQLNIPWHVVIFMAAIIYAGSAEFLVVTMLAKSFPFFDILIAASLVNLRHIFYGLSVHQHYPNSLNFFKRTYMIHALTDETYSLLAAKKDIDQTFSFFLSFFNHLYWVTGVTLGVAVGYCVAFKVRGLEFCLTALFVVLAVEQFFHIKRWFPFAFALIAVFIAQYCFPSQMLMVSMLLVTIMLIITHQWRVQRELI